MKGSFIENASQGYNKWWHYASSIFSVVVVIAILFETLSCLEPYVQKTSQVIDKNSSHKKKTISHN
ncbi:MAG: hypothetical protein ACK57K_09730, partial [Chryseotalea sp.]